MDEITLTKELIAIGSTNPGIYEEPLRRYIESYLKRFADTQSLEVIGGRKDIRAVLPSEHPEAPALIFICHMDTVPYDSGWTVPPDGALERDGRIYGRGACDMKSGLACALTAFKYAAAAVKAGCTPARSLVFIGTADEETNMRGVEKAIEAGWIRPQDYVLDTEPTNGSVCMAHKGRTWFRVDVLGAAAHASQPEKGADAVAAAAMIIAGLRSDIQKLPADDILGRSTVTFGTIAGGAEPYAVPEACSFTVDLRLVPPFETADIKRLLEKQAALAAQAIPGIRTHITITGDRPPIPERRESELLNTLYQCVLEVTGSEPAVLPFTGYTDSAVAAGMLGCQNTLSYGPGSLAQAHKPDEYVEREQITRCKNVLENLINKLVFKLL